jgi:hypothetical protein
MRLSIATLPMPQRSQANAKRPCKLSLRHADVIPNGFDVESRHLVDDDLIGLPGTVRNGLFETRFNTVECITHI